jgi:MarR family transcriptional regulator, transcriptional regulator for hemolysin
VDKFQYLGFLLDDTARVYARCFQERSRALSLEPAHCKVLVVLAENPGINQTRVSEICHLDPAHVTRILDLLETLGWAQRHPEPRDRRAHTVAITSDAEPILQRIYSIIGETHLRALCGFSASEIGILADLLERMRTNLIAPEAAAEPSGTSEGMAVRLGR